MGWVSFRKKLGLEEKRASAVMNHRPITPKPRIFRLHFCRRT